MSKNLVIFLGAGATAAISDCKLPTASNFFDKNDVWHNNINNYPHLEVVCEKVRKLKEDSHPTLTDVWLFIDTFAKYHLATYFNNREYDKKLLLKRWDTIIDIPYYLTQNYLNREFANMSADMKPLISRLDKQIYPTWSHNNPIEYFYTLAGWELKHLLYTTYSIHQPCSKKELFNNLLMELNKHSDKTNITIVNMNYDLYFESCLDKQNNKINLLKPHGGWNIRHLTVSPPNVRGIDKVQPFHPIYEYIQEICFDRICENDVSIEMKPAMIPYFISPDEISDEHNNRWPDVDKYFADQQDEIKKAIEKASHIITIGYSFSEDDKHIGDLVKEEVETDKNKTRKMLCVLKLKDENTLEYKRIKELWEIQEGDFYNYNDGFNEDTSVKIEEFLN